MADDRGLDRHHALGRQVRDARPESAVNEARGQVEQQVNDPRGCPRHCLGWSEKPGEELVELFADAFQA